MSSPEITRLYVPGFSFSVFLLKSLHVTAAAVARQDGVTTYSFEANGLLLIGGKVDIAAESLILKGFIF